MDHSIGNADVGTVMFRERDGRVWPSRLFSSMCGSDGEEYGPSAARGPAVISTPQGRFEGAALEPDKHSFSEHSVTIAWTTAGSSLRLETVWELCPETGVLSRRDRLTNRGQERVTILRCLSRFVLPPGRYELYSQNSRWCNEAQGRWVPLHTGTVSLGGRPGRSTEGGSPYACLREVDTDNGLVFHVLPNGNWTIQVRMFAVMNGLPYAVVDLGLSDRDLHFPLSPGETLELPELLVQDLPRGEPRLAAPPIHAYANKRYSAGFPEPPVVYNTWFDDFLTVDPPRVREQLAAAKDLGCEVFVIDDGWYGPEESEAIQRIGDWRERQESAFRGKLKEFADEVRAEGLGFGLWIEPEGAVEGMPVRRDHPDWFVATESNRARIDLENPDAYAWLRDEIIGLIETYDLAWLKVDFNFDLGEDRRGKEFVGYCEALHRLWREIRSRCPDTFIEGCASGGMRLDLNSLHLCDGHFLSDTVNPTDVAHISQGTLLRIPPGRIARWLTVRAVDTAHKEDPESVVVPRGATWASAEKVPIAYAACAALPGIMGLSGTVSGLAEESREQIRWYVDFYKSRRGAIRRSAAHLLTPPESLTTRADWVALQLQDPESGNSLVAAYHLKDGRIGRLFRLQGLDRERAYEVIRHAPQGPSEPAEHSGAALMDVGLKVDAWNGFPQNPGAAIYSVTAVRR